MNVNKNVINVKKNTNEKKSNNTPFIYAMYCAAGNLARIESDMKKLLVDTYKKTDEEFLKIASKQWVASQVHVMGTTKHTAAQNVFTVTDKCHYVSGTVENCLTNRY